MVAKSGPLMCVFLEMVQDRMKLWSFTDREVAYGLSITRIVDLGVSFWVRCIRYGGPYFYIVMFIR